MPDPRIRPFLAQLPSGIEAIPESIEAEETALGVRAYVMTSGRADLDIDLAFETMLTVSDKGARAAPTLTFEKARIVELCLESAQSTAELAARLKLPIGAVRILAADLVDSDLLIAHATQADFADDVDMIQRLIHGIRSL